MFDTSMGFGFFFRGPSHTVRALFRTELFWERAELEGIESAYTELDNSEEYRDLFLSAPEKGRAHD